MNDAITILKEWSDPAYINKITKFWEMLLNILSVKEIVTYSEFWCMLVKSMSGRLIIYNVSYTHTVNTYIYNLKNTYNLHGNSGSNKGPIINDAFTFLTNL